MNWHDELCLDFKLAFAPMVRLAFVAIAAVGANWGCGRHEAVLAALCDDCRPVYTFSARFESGSKHMNGVVNVSIGYVAMGFNAQYVGDVDVLLKAKSVEPRRALLSTAQQQYDSLLRQIAVVEVNRQILSASSYQTENIGQVAAAVTQLNQVVRQNAVLFKQSAADAEGLRQQPHLHAHAATTFSL